MRESHAQCVRVGMSELFSSERYEGSAKLIGARLSLVLSATASVCMVGPGALNSACTP